MAVIMVLWRARTTVKLIKKKKKKRGRPDDTQRCGRLIWTYCFVLLCWRLVCVILFHYIKQSQPCSVFSFFDASYCKLVGLKIEIKEGFCVGAITMEIIDGPFASLLLVHLLNSVPCFSFWMCVFCVFAGFHRLHSLSWVYSHRVCGLPGKQEDPPPQMVMEIKSITSQRTVSLCHI